MAKSRKRSSTINRIRYYNKQVDSSQRVRINKNLSTRQLNQLERDVKTTTYLKRADLDVTAKNVDAKNVDKFKRLSQAYNRQDTKAYESELISLRRSNKGKIKTIQDNLSKVDDIGAVDFTIETLKGKPKNNIDVEILAGAIAKDDFAISVMQGEVDKLEKLQGVQEVGGVNIDTLKTLTKRAKQYIVNITQSPKIALDVSKDEFDLVE